MVKIYSTGSRERRLFSDDAKSGAVIIPAHVDINQGFPDFRPYITLPLQGVFALLIK